MPTDTVRTSDKKAGKLTIIIPLVIFVALFLTQTGVKMSLEGTPSSMGLQIADTLLGMCVLLAGLALIICIPVGCVLLAKASKR